MVYFVVALLVVTAVGYVTRSSHFQFSDTAIQRIFYVTGCVAFTFLLRQHIVNEWLSSRGYSRWSEIRRALLFTMAIFLSVAVFEGTFNYPKLLFYACLLAWVIWTWDFSKARDSDFKSVMNFLSAGWIMLSCYLTIGQFLFSFARKPIEGLKTLHPILDLRLVLLGGVIAVLLFEATNKALNEHATTRDLIPLKRLGRGKLAPILAPVVEVLNMIWRTIVIMAKYMTRIGQEFARGIWQQALHVWPAVVAALLMAAFFCACWLIQWFGLALTEYWDLGSLSASWVPFATLVLLYVIAVVWAYSMNRWAHSTLSKWHLGFEWDKEGWKRSIDRFYIYPSFLLVILWFASLLMLGLSRIEGAGLEHYPAPGPFVLVIGGLIVVGLVYVVVRKRKEAPQLELPHGQIDEVKLNNSKKFDSSQVIDKTST